MTQDRESYFRALEQANTHTLDREAFQIIRVDGRAFHTLTRNMTKPYSTHFALAMNEAAQALCADIQGAVFAYVQSDEISVLVAPPATPQGQMWFGGQLRKWLSITAGIASATCTQELNKMAVFDSRVLSLGLRMDVLRYFLWRQSDCARNAIQATAQHHIGHKNIHGKDRTLQLQMLASAGVDYVSDYPQGWRQGRVLTPYTEPMTITFTHKRTGEVETADVERTQWRAQDAPWFDWDADGFLETVVPAVK